MIIVLAGRRGSGKTSVAKRLRDTAGFKMVEVSDEVTKLMKVTTRDELLDKHEQGLNKLRAEDVFIQIAKAVDGVKENKVICGIRQPELLDLFFQRYFPDIVAFYLAASPDIRKARMTDQISDEQFAKLEKRDDELGVGRIASSPYILRVLNVSKTTPDQATSLVFNDILTFGKTMDLVSARILKALGRGKNG